MAYGIRKLPFPHRLATVPCHVVLNGGGVSEDGAPTVGAEIRAKCIFSEHASRRIDQDGKAIMLAGKAIIEGDIAPMLPTISDGICTVNGRVYEIHAGHRPRNPDGSVHHSELELR